MEGNMDVHEKEGYVWVSVNPKIYPLAVVYSAAYSFIDDCYVLIDGDPVEEIIVELRPKEKKDLRTLGLEFNTELVNYANYTANYIKNAKIKETILKRVLLTNSLSKENEKIERNKTDKIREKETNVLLGGKDGEGGNKQKKE